MKLYQIFIITFFAGVTFTTIFQFVRKPKNWWVDVLKNFAGSFFIFSGVVKALDPLGTSYKLNDYFSSFASDFEKYEGIAEFFVSLKAISIEMAVAMIVIEIVLGIALIVGFRSKITTWIYFLMVLSFTLLTGYTYLSGYCITPLALVAAFVVMLVFCIAPFLKGKKRLYPIIGAVGLLIICMLLGCFTNLFLDCGFDEKLMKVTDCGCFGDFLKLDPWVTFYKDIFLFVVAYVMVLFADDIKDVFEEKKKYITAIIVGLFTIVTLMFCLNNYVFDLPMVDFRPYKIGNDLREQTKVIQQAEIEMVFIYKNTDTGEEVEVKTEDLGGLDYEVMEYVDRKDKVLDPGIPAKIDNFIIEDEYGADVSEDILYNEGVTFMVVAYDTAKANEAAFTEKINALAAANNDKHWFFAVSNNANDAYRHRLQTPYPFYQADATFLKTIIRSNPGLLLIKDGIVLDKWHHRKIPTFEEIAEKHNL